MRITTILLLLLNWVISGFAQQDLLTTILADPAQLQVINQKLINTPQLEFSPVFYADRIAYVANGRKDPAQGNRSNINFYNLYAAGREGDSLLFDEQPFSAHINSPYHEGPFCFTSDLDTIYFTRNNQLESGVQQKIKRLSIFMSYRTPEGWSEAVELLSATDAYSFCHPAVSSDGNRLYFTSNLPGGFGNYDLYYIEKTAEGWSNAINMGPEVNSPENELFPTLLNDHTLSFSSNRKSSLGGLDIFISLRSNENFDTPIRPGAPVNSPADDLGLVLSADQQYAYLSSNRPGGAGQDDIYALAWKKEVLAEAVPVQVILLDQENRKRLANILLRIQQANGKEEVFSGYSSRDGIINTLLVPDQNYIFQANSNYFEPLLEIIRIDKKTIYLGMKPKPCFTISGIAVDNENKERLAGSRIYLYNSCQDTKDSTIADAMGKFNFCMPPGCFGKIVGDQAGFHSVSLPVDTLESNLMLNLNFEKIKVSILKEPVKKGSVISLDNIYYNFNQATIRPGAERELNELVTLMQQYPAMEVKLVSHTDTRGSESSNLTLSVKRAEAAKNYLIANGIAAGRIMTEGRGETQPRNRCKNGVNCTEDEHQFNRRTEVVILKMD